MEMNAQATKLQAAENDLKQLMADVTRAMEKAQEAVARIAFKAGRTRSPPARRGDRDNRRGRPSTRCALKRSTHLATVFGVVLNRRAAAVLVTPVCAENFVRLIW
jgi:hypothetical protein